MLAKALLAIKPEFIRRMRTGADAGLQGVGVAAAAQVCQRCLDDGSVVMAMLRAQRLCPCGSTWVEGLGQLQVPIALVAGELLPIGIVQIGLPLVAQHLGDGACGEPLQIGGGQQSPDGRFGLGHGGVQGQQPALQVRLQRDLVARGIAQPAGGQRAIGRQRGLPSIGAAAPVAAIKMAEYGPPKIQQALRGRLLARGIKAHTQCHAAVLRQLGHLAHRHIVGKPGAALVGLYRQAPQRGKAWKAEKQHQHDGGTQQHE